MSMDGAAPMPAGAPTSRPTGGTHAMHAAPAAKPANPPASAEADTSAQERREDGRRPWNGCCSEWFVCLHGAPAGHRMPVSRRPEIGHSAPGADPAKGVNWRLDGDPAPRDSTLA